MTTVDKGQSAPKQKEKTPVKPKATVPKKSSAPKPTLARTLLGDRIEELEGLYAGALARRSGIRQRYKNQLAAAREELEALDT